MKYEFGVYQNGNIVKAVYSDVWSDARSGAWEEADKLDHEKGEVTVRDLTDEPLI
ncbi:MAG: hypothetical protein H7Y60_09665 [Rhodospirillaceae bacterium]|nr:hypothetical protein [Rhodospirillales bacterium]